MSNNRTLERINDDELHARLNAVRAMIRRARKHGGDTSDAEIELCYLEREEEHRQNRKNAHFRYIKKVKEVEERNRALRREEDQAVKAYLSNKSELELLH
jgi:hypothetical protein